MSRVKVGVMTAKHRRNTLKRVKGYRFSRSKKKKAAYEAIAHAGKHAFAHRKDKKNDFRRLWTVRINGGLDAIGETLSYSRLIDSLKKNNIEINRKMLALLAEKHENTFRNVVAKAK